MAYQNGATCEHFTPSEHLILQNNLFTSEVTHRIANSLTLLAASISNRASHLARQQRSLSSEEVSLLLREISSRVAAVGQLHRDIASHPDAAELDLNAHLWKLCDNLVAAVAQPGQFELLRGATDRCTIATNKVLPISMIVAEIATNALKYSHPTGVRGSLSVGAWRSVDGSVVVEIADDGVGLPEGFDSAADGGLGSKTVGLLARQLGAETSYVPRSIGVCFRLRLPPAG